MSETNETFVSGFFNSVEDDRTYNAVHFANYFGVLVSDGVFPNPSTNMQVLEHTGMKVKISKGMAWIKAYFAHNMADYTLSIEPADGTLKRIDRIVLRLDLNSRLIKPEVIKGKFGTLPVAPTLVRNDEIHDIALADVYVANGTTAINQSMITDQRLNKDLCGLVHALINQVDTTTIFNQYQSWFNQYSTGKALEFQEWQTRVTSELEAWIQAEELDFTAWKQNQKLTFTQWSDGRKDAFDIWFATIRGILDTEAAGNIMNVINDHKDSPVPHKYYDEGLAQPMQYGMKRNAELDTPAFVYGATEAGPHEVINLPNYEQVEGIKNVIDETAGKVITIDGVKYLPKTKLMLKNMGLLQYEAASNGNSHVVVTDKYLFFKQYGSGYSVLYEKSTGRISGKVIGGGGYATYIGRQAVPSFAGYINSRNAIVPFGPNNKYLLFPTQQSGGLHYICIIDTDRWLNTANDPVIAQTNSSINSGTMQTFTTSKWVVMIDNGYVYQMFRNDLEYNVASNPVMAGGLSGMLVNGSGIKNIFGVIDIKDPNPNVVGMVVMTNANAYCFIKINIETVQLISFINVGSNVSYRTMSENRIYEDDIRIVSSIESGYWIFDKQTYNIAQYSLKSGGTYRGYYDHDSESVTVASYAYQTLAGGYYNDTIHFRIEKLYFNGRAPELLPSITLNTREFVSANVINGGYIEPIFGKGPNDIYLRASEQTNVGNGTPPNGFYKLATKAVIDYYEEVK